MLLTPLKKDIEQSDADKTELRPVHFSFLGSDLLLKVLHLFGRFCSAAVDATKGLHDGKMLPIQRSLDETTHQWLVSERAYLVQQI